MQPLQEKKLLSLLVRLFVLAAGLGPLFLFPSRTSAGSDCEGTTVQITACLEREYGELDSRLNRLYTRILDGLGPPGKRVDPIGEPDTRELFVNAQRTWLAFRDQECKARQSYFSEGSMGKVELMECRIELTKDRITLLENWLELLGR
ncbi:MAG: lysozyme inhibitor LprI family protein [Thermodesulfobacteriota bacterium]